MMKQRHTRFCASAAIAAVLALSSTPLLAQVAEIPSPVAPQPELVTPESPPPAPVEPTVVAPPPSPEAAPQPTVSRQSTTPTATTTRTERVAAPARQPAARVRTAAPADPARQAVVSESAPVNAEPVAEPLAPLAVEEPAAEPAPVESGNSMLVGLTVLGAAAALILAIWGFIAIGRRRPISKRAVPVVERPVVTRAEPVPPLADPRPLGGHAAWATAPAASMAHSGASVPLPRTMPATFEERDALIKRMIAAKPDRANPFTSPIQRRKRAKLILQSLGRDFGDTEPWIDLSQYPQNWPEVARNRYAAA